MSDFVNSFIKDNKPQIEKYKKYFKDNHWGKPVVEKDDNGRIKRSKYYYVKDIKVKDVGTIHEGKEPEYKIQDKIVKTVLSRLKYFHSFVENDIGKSVKVDRMIKSMVDLIEYHTRRVDRYIRNSDSLEEKDEVEGSEKTKKDYQSEEINFDNELYKDRATINDGLEKLDLEQKKEKSLLELKDDAKAPLAMREKIEEEFLHIREYVKTLGIDFTSPPKNEMFVNIKNPPEWDVNKHYFEQEKKTLQFYVDEFKKIKNGIKLNGVHISGWLYTHLNVFKAPIPVEVLNELSGEKTIEDKIINPKLRDNEWFIIQQAYKKAAAENRMMFLCATRRAAKTTLIDSHLQWKALSGGKTLVVAGGSAKDLSHIEKGFKITMTNAHPAFYLPNISNDWSKSVKLGMKKKNQRDILVSTLDIYNLDGGTEGKSELLAGLTPDTFVLDECMKSPFKEQLDAALPAFEAHGKMRFVPMLAGCVCKGTKVWNNKGELVNIEDLKQQEGIIGYNGKSFSKEPITWMKPPTKKPSYRITTTGNYQIECSEDHPLLSSIKTNSLYASFKRADSLKEGDYIYTLNKVNIFGRNNERHARLFGLLVGDGYNENTGSELYTDDDSIYDWVKSNYSIKIVKEFKTNTGNTYRRLYIKGLKNIFENTDIPNKTGINKELPENWGSYTKKALSELIAGLFDSDGSLSIKNEKIRYRYRSISFKIIDNLRFALSKYGIHPTITVSTEKQTIIKGKVYNRKPIYELSIARAEDILIFVKNIKLLSEHKKLKIENLEELNKKSTTSTIKKISVNKEGKGKYFENLKNNTGLRRVSVKKIEYIGERDVYNLTAGNTNTYIANGFVTHNTGGNESLAQDATKILKDPVKYQVTEMDWDALEEKIPPQCITWKRRKFATFLPGQMSVVASDLREQTNLSEYLGVKSKELEKIEIFVTDWEKSKERFEKRREEKKHDKKSLYKEKVYFPLDPEDILLSGDENPFPKEALRRHRDRLIEEGNIGKNVELFYDERIGQVTYELSNKEVAEFPFGGGFHDSPVTIYEDPLPNAPFELVVSGCLLPGEKVLTEKGEKNVEDVTLEDKLINKEGDYVDINSLQTRYKNDEYVYSLRVGGSCRYTTFTKEHPIYVSRPVYYKTNLSKGRVKKYNFGKEGFVEAKDIEKGDWVKFPNIYYNKKNEFDIDDLWNKHKENIESPLYKEDFWLFLGTFLGDGWTQGKYKVVFSFSTQEELHIKNIENIIKNIFNKNVYKRKRKKAEVIELSFSCKELNSFLNENFSEYALNKNIPEWVKKVKDKFKYNLICGYLNSDGCTMNHPKGNLYTKFVSISQKLLEDFQDILYSLKIVSSITKLRDEEYHTFSNGYTSKVKKAYQLVISQQGTLKIHNNLRENITLKKPKILREVKKYRRGKESFMSDDGMYIYNKVIDITSNKYTGYVYNFDCDTHTFVTKNISTHNCDDYKQEQANSDSVGSFVLVRRDTGRVVASYHSRPDPHGKFHEQGKLLLELYNTPVFMENEDMGFKEYTDRQELTDEYILKSVDFLGDVNFDTNNKRQYGWQPTTKNKSFLFGVTSKIIDKKEEYEDSEGRVRQRYVFERTINDIRLLDEMINYKAGGNFDGLTALMSAYGYDFYLEVTGQAPQKPLTEEEKKKKQEMLIKRKERMTKRSLFPKSHRRGRYW